MGDFGHSLHGGRGATTGCASTGWGWPFQVMVLKRARAFQRIVVTRCALWLFLSGLSIEWRPVHPGVKECHLLGVGHGSAKALDDLANPRKEIVPGLLIQVAVTGECPEPVEVLIAGIGLGPAVGLDGHRAKAS